MRVKRPWGFVSSLVLACAAALALITASAASAADYEDYSGYARAIVPSGQYGAVPPPPQATDQAEMYDGLTPLFDDVTDADIDTYFKSEEFGVGPDGPGVNEPVPRDGVTITRDSFYVPHIQGETMADGVWASGWLLAEDRGLLIELARYAGRVAAIDAPGLTALGVLTSFEHFEPSEQTENEIAKQTKALKKQGKPGKRVLEDIDTFIEGINAYLEESGSSNAPWTRNDVYALNALKGQFLGQGGGDEARRSEFLDGLQQELGGAHRPGRLRRPAPVQDQGRSDLDQRQLPLREHPRQARRATSSSTTTATRPRPPSPTAAWPSGWTRRPAQASNTLQVNSEASSTGHPLMVGGPQIGYFYPGFTYEMDMHAGKMNWRGVTSAPFPGYLLIGRGEDFANTLTSASGDIIDQYAETLCGGSDTKYKYNGKCREMETFDAGTLAGEPVVFKTTVHGPVTGYATTNGRRVAISSKRSSYGKDVLDQLFFRRLSVGRVDDPESFYRAAAKTPQTFNSFYLDDKDNAEYTSGLLPLRPEGVDPGLPTKGTGKYEWQGFLKNKDHPHGSNPKDGTITNWNQNIARGFGTADDQWMRAGSVGRINLLNHNMKKEQLSDGTWDLAGLTSAMNAAATQDVRAIVTVPLLNKLLKGTTPPNNQAKNMLAAMKQWRAEGGSRLDLDLDGEIDAPGAASMDEAWPKIANAFIGARIGPDLADQLDTLASRFDEPPSGQYSGWYQYFDRDIKALLGQDVKDPFTVSYCGRGDLEQCQTDVWNAIAEAGAELEADQGSANPANWHSDADAERITFAGVPLTTMRYANRPSGTQQVIYFDGPPLGAGASSRETIAAAIVSGVGGQPGIRRSTGSSSSRGRRQLGGVGEHAPAERAVAEGDDEPAALASLHRRCGAARPSAW